MGGHRVTLPLPVDPPFSFRWAMEYLSSSPSTVLENVDPHAGLQRVLYLHGRPVLLVLRSASEDVEHPALFVEMHSERKISRAICDAGLQWARNMLNLDQNPHDFLKLGKRDAPLRQLQEQFRGMRPVRLASPMRPNETSIVFNDLWLLNHLSPAENAVAPSPVKTPVAGGPHLTIH